MDLIDRYILEVGRHLPRKIRFDVQAELRSLLTETLDERARAVGRLPDAELAGQVLREFGSPEQVAARYVPTNQYLIGPRFFAMYMLIAKIILIVNAAVYVALAVAALVFDRGPMAPLSLGTAAAFLGKFLTTALVNLALLTLAFAVVERVQTRREAEALAWDPATLPPIDDPDRISPAALVVGMYAILTFAVLFNFYPEWLGIVGFRQGRGMWQLPLLRPEFAMHMPLINVWWGLDFALCLVVLRHGRWRRETRWAEFALGLLGALILYLIAVGPPVFRYDMLVKAVLKGILVIVLIESGLRLYRLLTRRTIEPWNAAEAEGSRERAS